jgi:hypothetical protein
MRRRRRAALTLPLPILPLLLKLAPCPAARQVKEDGTISSVEDQLVDTLGKVLGKQEGEWEKAGA